MTESYDNVIVGAGSAGCALAGRLSEATEASICVIAPGPPSEGRLFEVSGLFARQLKSLYDWDFETDPEPRLGGRRKYLPRGSGPMTWTDPQPRVHGLDSVRLADTAVMPREINGNTDAPLAPL